MKNFDIDLYTIEELVIINKQIVAQVKFLQRKKQLEAAAKFKIGDIVTFLDKEDNMQEGLVTHITPKKLNLTTLTEPFVDWTIAPSLATLKRNGEKADLFKLFDIRAKTTKEK